MKKLTFQTNIKAPKEKVWKILWDDTNYQNWTSVFGEGSKVVTDWKEGGKVLFLGGNGDEGMFSIINKNLPNNYMSFKHLGIIKNGKEEPQNEESQKWSGAMENYTLTEDGDITTLTVDVEITEEHLGYMNDTFPKALEKVKSLSEQS